MTRTSTKSRLKAKTATPDSSFALRGDAVTLRPFTRRHLMSAEYLAWMNDPEVTRTIGRFDYLFPVSRAKLVRYFESLDGDREIFLAINVKETGRSVERFVGTLKIYDIDYLARRASLGILVGDRKSWGRGIASAAIGVACGFVFEELGFNKVCAGYMSTNTAMRRAFEKNEFVVEGVLKDHLYLGGSIIDHVLVGKIKGR